MEEFAAIIPAAGMATRLSPLPFSKELLPAGAENDSHGQAKLRVISSFLIENLQIAGISNIHFVLRAGKWDIPAYYQGGKREWVDFAYHVTENLQGPPFSIDAAYPFIKNKNIVVGFPDIVISSKQAISKLKASFIREKPDVLLGLFPQNAFTKWDMVDIDKNNQIKKIVIKSESAANLRYAWFSAIWNFKFSQFLHDYLKVTDQAKLNEEPQLGKIFMKAADQGFKIQGFPMDDVQCLDTGTVEGYSNLKQFLNIFF
ncbi:MAG: hypothetical protein KDC05_04520 [Bacteroidales bacterium]|nr:hypothetical protein [Bacteroidales bacterium]